MMPTYEGLELKFTKTADREMVDCGLYVDDVIKILEEGTVQSRSKRKKGTVEKVCKIRGEFFKVVAVESITQWNNETVLLIIHVGDTRDRK